MAFIPRRKIFVVRNTASLIEPEEILPDVHNLAGFSLERSEGKAEVKLSKIIYFSALSVFFLLVAIFEFRLGHLTLVKGSEFFALAEENRIDLAVIPAPRGNIVDRYSRVLAASKPGFSLIVAKHFLPSESAGREKVLGLLSSLSGVSVSDLSQAVFSSEDRYILVQSDIDRDKALIIKNRLNDLPGVLVEEHGIRSYLWPEELAHLVGFLGKPSKDDLKLFPDLSLSELVGKSGLEKIYQNYLHGISGRQLIEVDARGRSNHQVLTQKPVAGGQVVLTLDLELQKKIYEVLKRAREESSATGASAVVLDYTTGEIYAQVSIPSFDPAIFNSPGNTQEVLDLFSRKDTPLFNRAVQGMYPPGSSIKPFIASAALEENVIDPKKKVFAPLAIFVPNEYDSSIIYSFPDWRNHGYLDMAGALAWSSNVYFYTVGGGHEGVKGLGVRKIGDWLYKFGFGQSLGRDFQALSQGFIPTPEWKKRVRNQPWTLGDTYHVSIGQGDLLVTPLQLAAATGVIANGGELYAPYLVESVLDHSGRIVERKTPELVRSGIVKPDTLKVVREGMRQATQSGTISSFYSFKGPIYGKTGSAQTGPNEKIYSWFTGFLDSPQLPLVLTVMLEGGRGGDRTAAPVAREVLDWYATHRNISLDN